jgi:hypothetical protein
MATLNIDTADLRDELPITTPAHQCTVHASMIITPMSDTDRFNDTALDKDSFTAGCKNHMSGQQSTTSRLLSGSKETRMTAVRTLPDDHTDGRLLTFESHQTQSSIQNNKSMSGQVAVTFDGKNVPNNIPRKTETTIVARLLPQQLVLDIPTGLLSTCRLVIPIS